MLYPQKFGENPLYPQDTDFRVTKKDDSTGYGVMSLRAFGQGEIIAVMAGEIVSDIRQHTLQVVPDQHLHDTHFSGYFLHSCSPNVNLDMQQMTVTAIKDIEANTYIYMDYAQTEEVLYKQFSCGCGADNCRGWITGNKEVPPALAAEMLDAGRNLD